MCQIPDTIVHFVPATVTDLYPGKPWREGACSSLVMPPPSPVTTTIANTPSMTKLLCVVLASSLLLATVAGASSSSVMPSLGRHQAQVLGRKGRELGQYQHQSSHMQQPEVSS